jgi:Flp pilus assembly protein TadB
MAGVNGGSFAFEPFSQLTYEYRITTLAIIMLIFAAFGLIFVGLSVSTDVPDVFPFFFLGVLIFVMAINWTAIRYRQKKFMQQLELDFQRMKQVFAQPR